MSNGMPPYSTPARNRQVTLSDDDLKNYVTHSLRLFSDARDRILSDIHAKAESRPMAMDEGLPFEPFNIDLTSTSGIPYDREGYGIYFRRENSNPQARLVIRMGGDLYDIYPGQRIVGYFRRFDVFFAARGSVVGNANLIIEKRPDARYEEPPDNSFLGERFAPIDLLGVSATPTFIAQALTAGLGPAPTGLSPSGSFIVSGFRTLRLLIDGKFTSSGTCTTFNLVPWVREPNSGLWYEQGSEIIGFPDSQTSGQRYRTTKLSVYGTGKMYFQFASFGGTETGPGLIVQAME